MIETATPSCGCQAKHELGRLRMSAMRKVCTALSGSTGTGCRKKALPGSRYCLFHVDRGPLWLAGWVGAILSLVLTEGFRAVVPSTESRQLAAARRETADLKKAFTEREEHLNYKMDSLLKGNETLQERLDPFLKLARARYPQLDERHALGKLEKDVEALELRAAQLEERMRPRHLSAAQRNALIAGLGRGPKGAVTLMAVKMDQEATTFANELGSALHAAGFNVMPYSGPLILSMPPGVWISAPPAEEVPRHAYALKQALNSVDISCDISTNPQVPPSSLLLGVGQNNEVRPLRAGSLEYLFTPCRRQAETDICC